MLPPGYRNDIPDSEQVSKAQPPRLNQPPNGVGLAYGSMLRVSSMRYSPMSMPTIKPMKTELPQHRISEVHSSNALTLGLGQFSKTKFYASPPSVKMAFDEQRMNKGNWDPSQTKSVTVSTFN